MAKKKNKKNKKKIAAKMQQLMTEQSYFSQYNREIDKIMFVIFGGFFLFGIGIANFYDTWMIGLGVGLLNLVAYGVIFKFFRGKLFSRLVASFLFWNFGAQFIAQMHGMYEMHFFFFIACTILLLYQDWKVILPVTLYTVVHHIGFYVVNYTGDLSNAYRDYFVDVDYLSISTFLIHLGVAAIHAVLCMLGSHKLRLKTLEQIKTNNLVTQENNNHIKQQKIIDYNVQLANKISTGDLEADIDNSEANAMTEALIKMRESLKDAKNKEITERYVIEGGAEIEAILRANNDNLRQLSDKVVSKIVNYIGAAQGALFLIERKRNEDPYMTLSGAFAYDRSKYLDKKVLPGEGLAGECWIEGKKKDLQDLPNDYVSIKSALGKANPRNIYIVPLEYNEQILGVLEIASFDPLDNLKKQFVDKVSESIAGSVSSVKVNEQTSKLLQESQDLTEQMRAQEEELRQNQEEMMATQEESNRQMTELREKYEAALVEIEEMKSKK